VLLDLAEITKIPKQKNHLIM